MCTRSDAGGVSEEDESSDDESLESEGGEESEYEAESDEEEGAPRAGAACTTASLVWRPLAGWHMVAFWPQGILAGTR